MPRIIETVHVQWTGERRALGAEGEVAIRQPSGIIILDQPSPGISSVIAMEYGKRNRHRREDPSVSNQASLPTAVRSRYPVVRSWLADPAEGSDHRMIQPVWLTIPQVPHCPANRSLFFPPPPLLTRHHPQLQSS